MQANTLERRLFYIPSYRIYGSVAGFYDYGPPGCAVKQNITQCWRQHFILEENMLEVRDMCPFEQPQNIRKTPLFIVLVLTPQNFRRCSLQKAAFPAKPR